ncbi:glycoside hydrolase [Crassisporium funariophilum]|nr:glycoside hydrolase [Crassisporium funariophilum]
MKLSQILGLAALAHGASAHCSTQSTGAVRKPANNSPVESVSSSMIRCNTAVTSATETVTVSPGSTIGFKLDNSLYHSGPAAIYIAKAPSSVAGWDGGGSWVKIAEWGATFNPFKFVAEGQSQLTTTLPNVPAGEYLVRIEQIGLHVAGAPQFYISCAQIKVTSGGGSLPGGVSIPGYISSSDPGLTVNIYYPVPTSYKVPGPSVWRG